VTNREKTKEEVRINISERYLLEEKRMVKKHIYGTSHHHNFPFKKVEYHNKVFEYFENYMDQISQANPSTFTDYRVNNLFVDLRNEICSLIDQIYQEVKVMLTHEVKITPSSRTRTFRVKDGICPSKGCQVCGENRAINFCHIIAREEGGADSDENLIPLCPNHHYLFDEGRLSKVEFDKIDLKGKASDAIEYFQKIHKRKHEMFWRYRTSSFAGCNCGSLDFDYDVTESGYVVEPCLRCKNCGVRWSLARDHPLQQMAVTVYGVDEHISDVEKSNRILQATGKIKNAIKEYLMMIR
jgi:hypothetical protein